MPIVKDSQAQPMVKDAVVLDLGDIAAEARRLRAQSRSEADRIIAEAKQRASELSEGAAAAGYQQGFEKGKAEGIEQGRAEGREEALTQMSDQLNQVTEAWTRLAADWDGERQQLHREAKGQVVEFALKLAEKIIHQRIEADPQTIVNQLSSALDDVLEPGDVTVRLHPDDRPTVEAALPRIVETFTNLAHVHLTDDSGLDRGGCVLSHGQGQIDASIQTQMERIAARVR